MANPGTRLNFDVSVPIGGGELPFSRPGERCCSEVVVELRVSAKIDDPGEPVADKGELAHAVPRASVLVFAGLVAAHTVEASGS